MKIETIGKRHKSLWSLLFGVSSILYISQPKYNEEKDKYCFKIKCLSGGVGSSGKNEYSLFYVKDTAEFIADIKEYMKNQRPFVIHLDKRSHTIFGDKLESYGSIFISDSKRELLQRLEENKDKDIMEVFSDSNYEKYRKWC